MTVIKTVDIVAVKSGKELTIKAAADLAAEMLVRIYVPEYDPEVMTFQEALELAELRDAQAAYDLEASIEAALAEDDAEDDVAAEVVNMLLESAELADRLEAEAAEEAVGL